MIGWRTIRARGGRDRQRKAAAFSEWRRIVFQTAGQRQAELTKSEVSGTDWCGELRRPAQLRIFFRLPWNYNRSRELVARLATL